MRPEDIAFSPGSLVGVAAPTVRVRWLGTAGFAIEHDGHVLLLDPYLTRASLARCVAAPLRADTSVHRRVVARADAIVVGHTHFDHVLDVPDLALATGAKVFGSRSAGALCRARGVPEAQVEVVEQGGTEDVVREVGPFRLRFCPSAHSAFLFGRVPFPGEIADCTDVPLRTEQYRCGAVFGVEIEVGKKKLFHLGSAELVERGLAPVRGIDLLLLTVAGWTASRDLPERAGAYLPAGAVLLSHWDDFLRPIDRPARMLPAMQMPRLVERLTRAMPGVRVGTLPLLGELFL